MQLNEILEENSVKSISQKTNISEINLNTLAAGEFDKLKRVNTMGFISILEREYKADLSVLKKQASEYYENNIDEESVTISLPLPEEKKGRSKWFRLLILGLTLYTVWYFFTQFDKTLLSKYLPFTQEEISRIVDEDIKKELSIENMNKQHIKIDSEVGSEASAVLDNETNVSND
jgi:hypothetical protein